MGVSKTCQQCGTVFTVPHRRSELVKFCSLACKTAAGWAEYKCGHCGVLFKRKKSSTTRSKAPYCSVACYRESQPGRTVVRGGVLRRYFKQCEVCHSLFGVSAARRTTARWCSRECQGKSPDWAKRCSEAQQGDKHWRWAGGKYKQNSGYIRSKRKADGQEFATFNHRIVILQALLSENPDHPFVIEVNGEKRLDPQIEVHHVDRDRANNALPNLIAVTKYAHAQIHHRNRKPQPWECWPSNPTIW